MPSKRCFCKENLRVPQAKLDAIKVFLNQIPWFRSFWPPICHKYGRYTIFGIFVPSDLKELYLCN